MIIKMMMTFYNVGLSLFYSGMVREKNVLATIMQIFRYITSTYIIIIM